MMWGKKNGVINLVSVVLLFISIARSAGAALYYNATDLGTLPGGGSASAVNNLGVVVGTYPINSSVHAFTFNSTTGATTDLGILPGSPNAPLRGAAISNNGQTAGVGANAEGSPHAFRYASGTFTDLGSLTPFAAPDFYRGNSSAFGINSSGIVVGQSSNADLTANHAFAYNNGVMTDLGTLGGANSVAYAINDTGVIVGEASNASGNTHAFLSNGGPLTDLGVLPGFVKSTARGVNSGGDIVGGLAFLTAGNSLRYHAFLYRNSQMIDLGLPTLTSGTATESFANGISSGGQIWGSYSAGAFPGGPLIGTAAGVNQVIINGNWSFPGILGITDSGAIYAVSYVGNDVSIPHVLLLNEVPVPEPVVGTPLLLGILLIFRRRWLSTAGPQRL